MVWSKEVKQNIGTLVIIGLHKKNFVAYVSVLYLFKHLLPNIFPYFIEHVMILFRNQERVIALDAQSHSVELFWTRLGALKSVSPG